MSDYINKRRIIKKMFDSALYLTDFEKMALAVFYFQFSFNPLYSLFCSHLGKTLESVKKIDDIPFMPISFFKNHVVKTGTWKEEEIFMSSGTTGSKRSNHYVKSLSFYLQNTQLGFEEIFGEIKDYCFLAYLPGYSENPNSSLIQMLQHFISISKYKTSDFYLNREDELIKVLEFNKKHKVKTVLFGVSFALLELSKLKINFRDLMVIETGGMKTSMLDITKEEILETLSSSWKLESINSEYGMTELFSQSYAAHSKWYKTASTKRIIIGQLSDPFAQESSFKTGIIKIIDLANFDTCSFIESEDLGIANENEEFQVLGRLSNAELRGCNLLLSDT